MQINTIGSPTGLFGAGDAIPAAGGIGFAQLLGTPAISATPLAAGATPPLAPGVTPPLASNDTLAPATPLSMAQLLTTAAPLAPVASAPVPTPEAGAEAVTAMPVAPQPETGTTPAQPLAASPQPAPAEPVVAAAKPTVPATDAKPGKPAGEVQPIPVEAVPAAPVVDANADVEAEQPAEAPKAPVKRGPRLADGDTESPEAAPAATPENAQAATDMVAVALVQVPARPEVAVKAQPSPTRQIGEISTSGRKADAGRAAATDAPGNDPVSATGKAAGETPAVAGKQGKNDNAAGGDERGQAPAFALRQDGNAAAHAAAPAHTTTEPVRAAATPAATAPEPVVAARPGHLGQQMGVEIARKVEAGEDTLRVRLSPDNLGKVEVTLSFDDGGKLHATVRAESAHALDLLRQDAPDLGRALDQAGIRADAQSFRFESRGEGGNAQSQQQQGQNSTGNQLAGNDETDTTDTAYRSIRGDGQVDLLA